MTANGFTLDPRLEATGIALGDLKLSRVFLVDDARFPWLTLVPRRAGIVEILDLVEVDRQILFDEILQVSAALKAHFRPDKLNIGALGNVVPQLHVHVLARFVSDAAWPGPVWGHGERVPYPPHMAGPLMDKLRMLLGFQE